MCYYTTNETYVGLTFSEKARDRIKGTEWQEYIEPTINLSSESNTQTK